MSDYALTANDIVVRLADNANIPNDPKNADRVAYNAWLAVGNTPDPYIPPPPPPQTIVPQDLIDQLTAADAAKIQNALNANSQFWLGWQTLSSIRDPVPVTNARFKKAWTALTQILGAQRMSDIATALGVTVN